jgi:hypothetical protein
MTGDEIIIKILSLSNTEYIEDSKDLYDNLNEINRLARDLNNIPLETTYYGTEMINACHLGKGCGKIGGLVCLNLLCVNH